MKKIIINLFLALALIGYSSCNKVIEIKETDFIGGDVALKTVANNEQGIIGAYAALRYEWAYLLNAMLSDELKVGEFYNSQTIHEWQYSSSDVGLSGFPLMSTYYSSIDMANRVLKALPTATANSAADEALRSKLKGEALFLRAFSHFSLYQYYSNSSVATDLAMPYMEESTLEPQARITVSAYFQKLKADLVEAKPLLPNDFVDIYRTNRLSVSGLQARVALYLKEYADAITFSTEYINGLPLSPRSAFTGIWTDANKNEVSFKISRTASAGTKVGSFFRAGSSNSSNIGTVVWRPSDKLWNSYDAANDIRFTAYLKEEGLLASAGRLPKIISKYAGTAYGTAGENVADVKIFRTGEMYLIRAEAKAENNDLVGAAVDLNALRAARITNYVNVIFVDKADAINQIMDERFKELAYEGHRLFDLKRRNLPVSRLLADAQNTTSTTLAGGNFRFLLPIPITEIQANSKMQQNPGYTN